MARRGNPSSGRFVYAFTYTRVNAKVVSYLPDLASGIVAMRQESEDRIRLVRI